MASASMFKTALAKASAVALGSAALTLGFNAPANAVLATCPTDGGLCTPDILVNPELPTSFVFGGGNIGPTQGSLGSGDLFTFNILDPDPQDNPTFPLFEFEVDNQSDTSVPNVVFFQLNGPGVPLPILLSAGAGQTTSALIAGIFNNPGTYTVTVYGDAAAQSLQSGYAWDVGAYNNQVPGPLPVLGAGVAFGFSRNLRRRIAASKA